MENENHDALVKLTSKVDELCRKINSTTEDNEKAHASIMNLINRNFERTDKWISTVHERIDNQLEEKAEQVEDFNKIFLHSKVFYWVIGFVILAIFSAWGTISYLGMDVHKIDTKINSMKTTIQHYHPEDSEN